jgi:hypothetical protein
LRLGISREDGRFDDATFEAAFLPVGVVFDLSRLRARAKF